MRKTEVEKTLADIGINARDSNGNVRSADELTEEVMTIFNHCDGINKMLLLAMLTLAKQLDDDMYYLAQSE